jgi:arginase family enzyme
MLSDTWKPKVFGGSPSEQASINHGTYFFHAAQEGLLSNDSNIHAGIRTTLSGPSDYENDGYCGFEIVEAREVDKIGTDGIIKKIRDRVGTEKPVYLSIDIDTLDPACKSSLPDLRNVCLTCVQLLPLPELPRRVAGRHESSVPSFVASREST